MQEPHACIRNNLTAFLNVLEGCRRLNVEHLLYASSSSVYGSNSMLPFEADHPTEQPLSLYAVTKKSNELMAHAYSHLHGLRATGLRLFTVYGPWGRPDMAMALFTRAILRGEPVKLFNHGSMTRDFTYVADAVECIRRLLERPPGVNPSRQPGTSDPRTTDTPHRVYNIGTGTAVHLLHLLEVLEAELGVKAVREFLPLQAGDVPATTADVSTLVDAIDYRPRTSVEVGVAEYVRWYRGYHRV